MGTTPMDTAPAPPRAEAGEKCAASKRVKAEYLRKTQTTRPRWRLAGTGEKQRRLDAERGGQEHDPRLVTAECVVGAGREDGREF